MVRLRERAGLTVDQAADAIGRHASTVYRIEKAQTGTPQLDTLLRLLDAYAVRGAEREELIAIVRQPDIRGWWQPYTDLPDDFLTYLGFEHEATMLRTYDSLLIPGLLQAETYTAAALRATMPDGSDDEIGRRQEVRRKRQEALSGPRSLVLHAVIDEAAIRRPIGGSVVMAQQLRSLTNLPSNVTLQVVPFGAGAHAGLDGSFVLVAVGPDEVVFTEGPTGQLFADGGLDLHRYRRMWDALSSTSALTPEESAALISGAAERIETEGP